MQLRLHYTKSAFRPLSHFCHITALSSTDEKIANFHLQYKQLRDRFLVVCDTNTLVKKTLKLQFSTLNKLLYKQCRKHCYQRYQWLINDLQLAIFHDSDIAEVFFFQLFQKYRYHFNDELLILTNIKYLKIRTYLL